MDVKSVVADFLSLKTDIITFRDLYDHSPEINDFFQAVIDDMRSTGTPVKLFPCEIQGKTFFLSNGIEFLLSPETFPGLEYGNHEFDSVHNYLTYEWRLITHDVKSADGASRFYGKVYALYYQIDQSIPWNNYYQEKFNFALDVIPEYLSGGEAELYIQKNIIPLFPEDMKASDRKKAIKAKIKEEFKSEKGYPCWAQESAWPIGKDGRPTTYIGKGKSKGDYRSWRFRDESTGEIIVVEQYY